MLRDHSTFDSGTYPVSFMTLDDTYVSAEDHGWAQAG